MSIAKALDRNFTVREIWAWLARHDIDKASFQAHHDRLPRDREELIEQAAEFIDTNDLPFPFYEG